MVFSSIPFLFYFLPAFLLLYGLVPKNAKNIVLLAFSLVFYAWGEPVYVFLMLLLTFSDYMSGKIMQKISKKKLCLCYSVILDLLILGFFKYANFIVGILNSLLSTNVKELNLALPVGISFFTFQSLSYVIDLYRGKAKVEESYLRYLTYVSMFPQLVAGPIVRYSTVAMELRERKVESSDFIEGFFRFLEGLFKKVLLANQIGVLWEEVLSKGAGQRSLIITWLGAIAFTFQIYYDFSGYSDMAIGMGRMLGFHFDENFNYPLMSKSITDFWRRWHISLSGWFKEYVYIPLGGNRKGILKQIRNIMIVWMLTGLWHGASWNFVLWGLYYGIILLLEKLIYGKWLDKAPDIIKHIYSFSIIVFGFVIFAIDDFANLGGFIKNIFGINISGIFGKELFWYATNYGIIFTICTICCGIINKKHIESFFNKIPWLRVVIYTILFIITVASLVNDSYNPFLYFRF